MLEWKPKLITLILALVIVAALVGLLFPVSESRHRHHPHVVGLS